MLPLEFVSSTHPGIDLRIKLSCPIATVVHRRRSDRQMTANILDASSYGGLRDRLLSRFLAGPDSADDIDLEKVLTHLTALPHADQTTDSIDALIQLAKNFWYAGQVAEALRAASHAAEASVNLGDKLLLCIARGICGVVLSNLGRYGEATVSLVECCSIARDLGDSRREATAINDFGQVCGGMGQYEVAASYFEQTIKIADEMAFDDLALRARSNLAVCAVELRDTARGFAALSRIQIEDLTRQNVVICASAHHNLAHLHLLAGDLSLAQLHAKKSTQLAAATKVKGAQRQARALRGLVDVYSGEVKKGLLALDRALSIAKRVDHTEVLGLLRMCVDAHEAASQPDRALEYLQELVTWKKKTIDAEVLQLLKESPSQSGDFRTEASAFERGLAATARSLQTDTQRRLDHLVAMAINAEIAAGHDIHRVFRVAKIAHCLAVDLGWDEQRITLLTLAAQLSNIGMLAMPTDLLRSRDLTAAQRRVFHDHTKYGARLLGKSGLKCLEVASAVAEQHHECYDGTGYPQGLRGESILDEARLIAVCDAFDTLTNRPASGEAALSIADAVHQMLTAAGSQFDPFYVNVLANWLKREAGNDDDLNAFLAGEADQNEYVRARARFEMLLTRTA